MPRRNKQSAFKGINMRDEKKWAKFCQQLVTECKDNKPARKANYEK